MNVKSSETEVAITETDSFLVEAREVFSLVFSWKNIVSASLVVGRFLVALWKSRKYE